jgi:hypothetical protein
VTNLLLAAQLERLLEERDEVISELERRCSTSQLTKGNQGTGDSDTEEDVRRKEAQAPQPGSSNRIAARNVGNGSDEEEDDEDTQSGVLGVATKRLTRQARQVPAQSAVRANLPQENEEIDADNLRTRTGNNVLNSSVRVSDRTRSPVSYVDCLTQVCIFSDGARLGVCSDCMNIKRENTQSNEHITLRWCRIDQGHVRADDEVVLDPLTRDDVDLLLDYCQQTASNIAFACDTANRQRANELTIKLLSIADNSCQVMHERTNLLCCEACAANDETLLYCRVVKSHTLCNHNFNVGKAQINRHRWDLSDSFKAKLKAMWTFSSSLPLPVDRLTLQEYENYPRSQSQLDANNYSRTIVLGEYELKVCRYCNLEEHWLKRSLLRQCRVDRKHHSGNWDGSSSNRKWNMRNKEEAALVKAKVDELEGKRTNSSASVILTPDDSRLGDANNFGITKRAEDDDVDRDTDAKYDNASDHDDSTGDDSDEDQGRTRAQVFAFDSSQQLCYFTDNSKLRLCTDCRISNERLDSSQRVTLRSCRLDCRHKDGSTIKLKRRAKQDLAALSRYCSEGYHQIAFMCDVGHKHNARNLTIKELFRRNNICTLQNTVSQIRCCQECHTANKSLRYCRADNGHTAPNHQFNLTTCLEQLRSPKRHNWDLPYVLKEKLRAMWVFAEQQPIPVDRVSLEQYESYPSNRQLVERNDYSKSVFVDGDELKVCCYCHLEEHTYKRSLLWKCRLVDRHKVANWDASANRRGWYLNENDIQHVKSILGEDEFVPQSTSSSKKRKNLRGRAAASNRSQTSKKPNKKVNADPTIYVLEDTDDSGVDGTDDDEDICSVDEDEEYNCGLDDNLGTEVWRMDGETVADSQSSQDGQNKRRRFDDSRS